MQHLHAYTTTITNKRIRSFGFSPTHPIRIPCRWPKVEIISLILVLGVKCFSNGYTRKAEKQTNFALNSIIYVSFLLREFIQHCGEVRIKIEKRDWLKKRLLRKRNPPAEIKAKRSVFTSSALV